MHLRQDWCEVGSPERGLSVSIEWTHHEDGGRLDGCGVITIELKIDRSWLNRKMRKIFADFRGG